MTQKRLVTGKQGEEIALQHLRENGYKILEKNFRCKLGEIDIIARDQHIVVFIEVRTKISSSVPSAYGPPYNSVTSHKQRQVKRVALFYISRHNLVNTQFRFDVIGITLNSQGEKPHLDHIQNAFC